MTEFALIFADRLTPTEVYLNGSGMCLSILRAWGALYSRRTPAGSNPAPWVVRQWR